MYYDLYSSVFRGKLPHWNGVVISLQAGYCVADFAIATESGAGRRRLSLAREQYSR